jgi:ADP-ribosylglycohydrolase
VVGRVLISIGDDSSSPARLSGFFCCLSRAGNTLCSRIEQPVTDDTQMALLVLKELLTAIRAKDAQGFREWLGTALDTLG